MKRFLIGLGLGMLGAIVWIIASVLSGIGNAVGKPAPLIIQIFVGIGFFVMVVGPLYFWLIVSVWQLFHRQRKTT